MHLGKRSEPGKPVDNQQERLIMEVTMPKASTTGHITRKAPNIKPHKIFVTDVVSEKLHMSFDTVRHNLTHPY